MNEYLLPLLGGLLIGLAVTIMLLFNGRVVGISGIIAGLIKPQKDDTFWRLNFVLGMMIGGLLLNLTWPTVFQNALETSNVQLIIAGIFVGFGTLLGNGCTSGHGVCGISRFSPRSLIATVIFMSTGILIVYFVRKLGFFI